MSFLIKTSPRSLVFNNLCRGMFWVSLLLATPFQLSAQSAPPADPLAQAPLQILSANWQPLLDTKLTNWELWMGVPHHTVQGLPPGVATSPDGHKGTPLGLNNDPKHVFSLLTEDGEPVLHITGEIFGGLTTLHSYTNYHLRCQFRWGQKIWEPKLKVPRDNGILYDCTGPHGAFWNVWKSSVEFQVEDQNMGDLYLLAGRAAEVTTIPGAKKPSYDPNGKSHSYANSVAHLLGKFEVPLGQWNTLELYTIGQTSVHVVNGHVVMVLRNIQALIGPDRKTPVPLTSGQIQLQSEGAEADFRRVEIQGITDYPPEIKTVAGFK